MKQSRDETWYTLTENGATRLPLIEFRNLSECNNWSVENTEVGDYNVWVPTTKTIVFESGE